jgi:hypothetical protein
MHEDSKKHETPTDANNVLVGVLPPKEDILKEAEKQISDWLEGSTEKEKEHYRVAFRRSYEYIVRVTKK